MQTDDATTKTIFLVETKPVPDGEWFIPTQIAKRTREEAEAHERYFHNPRHPKMQTRIITMTTAATEECP